MGQQALTPRKDAESDWALLTGEGCESKRKKNKNRKELVSECGVDVMPWPDEPN
jgi:hypothetical protein